MIFAWLGASTDPAVLEHLCTLLQSGLEYYSALQWHQLRTTPISESGSVINNRRHQFGRFSSREMSSNVHYTQIRDPQLLDIIDEAWLRDKLPDDSKCPEPVLPDTLAEQ